CDAIGDDPGGGLVIRDVVRPDDLVGRANDYRRAGDLPAGQLVGRFQFAARDLDAIVRIGAGDGGATHVAGHELNLVVGPDVFRSGGLRPLAENADRKSVV